MARMKLFSAAINQKEKIECEFYSEERYWSIVSPSVVQIDDKGKAEQL